MTAPVVDRWLLYPALSPASDQGWACDFVATLTEDGCPVKLLTIVDEYTHEGMTRCIGWLNSLSSASETSPNTFGLILGRSLAPRPCTTGCNALEFAYCSLNQGVSVEMAISKIYW
jgi:hypothetical protein